MKGRQNHHLTLLLTPAGAVHHPQKIGLNPTHPIQAEMVAAEVAMCETTNKLKYSERQCVVSDPHFYS